MTRVLVVLGPTDISPATVTRMGAKIGVKQYLSPDQKASMGDDQTAIWEGEFLDGHWWLSTRLPNDAERAA